MAMRFAGDRMGWTRTLILTLGSLAGSFVAQQLSKEELAPVIGGALGVLGSALLIHVLRQSGVI